MKKEKWLLAIAAGAGAAAVLYKLMSGEDIPEGATVVQPFDKSRYLGKWYEVARLPSRIEKNIKSLVEEYTQRDDGLIEVSTKGYNTRKEKWVEFTGKAKSADAEDIGMLKVSYFGPFYLAYNVLDVDADYQYALVSGSSLDYLWILSREPTIPEDIKEQFLNRAAAIGFDIDKLEWDIV